MNSKVVVGIIAVLVIAAGAYYYTQGKGSSAPAESGKQAAHWEFKDQGEKDGIPQTQVSFNGKVVGTYAGSCSEMGAESTLLAGELSAVTCWYAGGGKEIGMFANEGGGYDIMEGDVDEGSAEEPGMRGNFVVKFTAN
jgi:hypothetical protein